MGFKVNHHFPIELYERSYLLAKSSYTIIFTVSAQRNILLQVGANQKEQMCALKHVLGSPNNTHEIIN